MYKNNNSKKPTGKGKSRYPKNTYKGKQEDRRNEMGKSVTNDIDWYLHYPDLTLNAGKLSMLYPGGSKQNFLREGEASEVWGVPAVMAIEYVPSYGYSNSLSDPLTRMSRSLFNNMVAKTNRVPSYEYTDLTMYQIAMTNLVQFYYWAARVYLVAGTYDAYNEAWNAQVFKALGVNGKDIIKNRSLLYSYLINFAHRISAFPFPKEFSLFERTAQLVSNIYCDEGDSKKAQMYLFNPLGGYKWDYELETGSSLKFVTYRSNTDINYARIVSIGDELIEAIAGSSDIQMMTSDILKVYADTLVTVNPVTEHGVIEPKYDSVVATQLMNANFTGSVPTNLDIMQATNGDELEPYVVATPKFPVVDRFSLWRNLRPMVNFLVDNPSEGTVLEGTRFMFTTEADEAFVYLKSFGSEILVQMRLIVRSNSETNPLTMYTFGSSALSDDNSVWKLVSALTCFDWHPRVAIFDAETKKYVGHVWDCANYAFLTDQQIELMNRAALCNLMLIYG